MERMKQDMIDRVTRKINKNKIIRYDERTDSSG